MTDFTRNALDILRVFIFELFGLGVVFHWGANDPSINLHEPGMLLLLLSMGMIVGAWFVIVETFLETIIIRIMDDLISVLKKYGFIKNNRKNVR